MQIFCACNSEWIPDSQTIVRRQQVVSCLEYKEVQCPICEYIYWHDADHENMMFDLRNMNN